MKKYSFQGINIAILILFLSLFSACSDDNSIDKEKAEENRIRLKANEFIYEQMAVFYLWNKQMWSDKPDENRDPIDYFEGLLASNDPWSRITDNANEFIKSLEGTGETFGFSISFGWINSEKTRIGAVVNYVYPQSPAANVGLKRGSLIIEVDGEAMTEDNYTRLHDLLTSTLLFFNFCNILIYSLL